MRSNFSDFTRFEKALVGAMGLLFLLEAVCFGLTASNVDKRVLLGTYVEKPYSRR